MHRKAVFLLLLVSLSTFLSPLIPFEVEALVQGPSEPIADYRMNWVEFWREHWDKARWQLQWYDGAVWQNITGSLRVLTQKTVENESVSGIKISLDFTSQAAGRYRLIFAVKENVLNYINRTGQYEYQLTYGYYNITFNWSDLLSIPNLILRHGVTYLERLENGTDVSVPWFWFMIQHNNVPANYHLILDPTLIVSSSYGVETGSQRRMFTTPSGVIFKFYSDGTNMVYKTSADDGNTWSNPSSGVRVSTAARQFTIWYDSSYNASRVWYIWTYNAISSRWYTRRGIINSTGNGITWGTEYQYGTATASYGYYYGTIILLPYGGLQAFVNEMGSGVNRIALWTTNNNDVSSFTKYTATWVVSIGDSTIWENTAVPLDSSNRSYVIYHQDASSKLLFGRRWNGASLDAATVISNWSSTNMTVGQNGVSLSSDGDESYAVWESHRRVSDLGYYEVVAHRTIFANNTLSSVTQISNDNQAVNEHGPTISIDEGNNTQVVLWGYSDDIYYRAYQSGSWGSIQSVDPAQSYVIEYTVNSPWHFTNDVPLTYQQNLISPYNLYFYLFSFGAQTVNFFGSIQQRFTINSERIWTFLTEGSITQQILIGAQPLSWTIDLQSLITQLFTINQEREWSFTLFSSLIQQFIIDGATQFISPHVLWLFGSITQIITIGSMVISSYYVTSAWVLAGASILALVLAPTFILLIAVFVRRRK